MIGRQTLFNDIIRETCTIHHDAVSKIFAKFISRWQTMMTRTRTSAFWGYLPPSHDYPYYWPVHIGSQVKRRQSQSYIFEWFTETSISLTLKNKRLHTTHLRKMLDKICKYEMEYCRRYRADTILSTDGQEDRRSLSTSHPHHSQLTSYKHACPPHR